VKEQGLCSFQPWESRDLQRWRTCCAWWILVTLWGLSIKPTDAPCCHACFKPSLKWASGGRGSLVKLRWGINLHHSSGIRWLPRRGNSAYYIMSQHKYHYHCSDTCWRRQGCDRAAGLKTSAPGNWWSGALSGCLARLCRPAGVPCFQAFRRRHPLWREAPFLTQQD